jgi:hypothetical protein
MAINLEQRVAALERQVADLQERREQIAPAGREWLGDLDGAFAGDPIFKQAMKLGRAYRKSTRPAARKPKARR